MSDVSKPLTVNSVGLSIPREECIAAIGDRGWTQGEFGNDKPDAPLCAHGAIRLCSPQPGDAYLIQAVWDRRGRGFAWNDSVGRTKSDVLSYFRECPDISDGELCETFGPQWLEIVGLVRRSARLTQEEAEKLAAAWDAAWDAARVAAEDAAWAAAEDAARAAARAAARDAARAAAEDAAIAAAWVATRAAAEDAAIALHSRDLIGDRFSAKEYVLLTRPWREVIGPVHPDDDVETGLPNAA